MLSAETAKKIVELHNLLKRDFEQHHHNHVGVFSAYWELIREVSGNQDIVDAMDEIKEKALVLDFDKAYQATEHLYMDLEENVGQEQLKGFKNAVATANKLINQSLEHEGGMGYLESMHLELDNPEVAGEIKMSLYYSVRNKDVEK